MLKPVAPGVWIVDGPEIRFAYAGLRLPFQTRMTVIALADGGLWLHSPTAPDETLAGAIEALGPVRHLIAPNTLHYWWIADWAARFPAAEVWGAPGLERAARRPLPALHVLQDAPPGDWAGDLDQVLVRGDALTEVDFFHRASRTLILTDLIENFEPERVRKSWLRWLIRLAGAADPDGKAPLDMQLSFLRQRQAVRAAAQRMIGWDPTRIILAHGRWYPENGTGELKRAFRWAL